LLTCENLPRHDDSAIFIKSEDKANCSFGAILAENPRTRFGKIERKVIMSTLELELLRASDQPKTNTFDYVTRLILPVLSLVALIATRNIKPTLSWPLGIFAIL
jgi:hypothetical protein